MLIHNEDGRRAVEMPMVFEPKFPGRYACDVTLICSETSDIRVFRVEGVSIAEGSRAELDLNVPARQRLTQDIPIINRSSKNGNIRVRDHPY